MSVDVAIPAPIAADLVDPKAYANDRIHNALRWLRANNPLGVASPEGFDPFWVVTRHADILEVSRQNDLFHNGDRATTLTNRDGIHRIVEMTGGSPNLTRALVQMDAPDHPKYRALTQAWFMPPNVKKLEGRIRQIARATVDKMIAAGGACDFVAGVALHYPLHVIMEILGVPESDEPKLLKLTQEVFGPSDPDAARDGRALSGATREAMVQETLSEFYDYFRGVMAKRRAQPTGDLASVIANGQIDGEPISEREALSYFLIVATAGHDTTSSSVAGAIWALAERPDQLKIVQANLSLAPCLVDEAIRWTTPVKTFMRSATRDTELAGRRIKAGDWLMLCYASGNRDEAVFEAPYEFRADRNPNRHLAFGYGAHLCLGQHLAKLEMRLLFEELLPRLGALGLNGQPKLTQSFFVNGPKTLPIQFEAA